MRKMPFVQQASLGDACLPRGDGRLFLDRRFRFGGASHFSYLENAGGSQVPLCVADAMRNYMLESYVQLGAGYEASQIATRTVEDAHSFIDCLMSSDAARTGRAALGPSSSQLLANLADCASRALRPGDEVVVAEAGHESNVAPWLRAAARSGATVKWWRMSKDGRTCPLDGLAELVGPRTRVVAFPHVSNLIGEVVDARGAATIARSVKALTVVDGVAFAPHRAMDVAALGVDFYAFSTYKVFGPHMAALFGTHGAWGRVLGEDGPNFFFVPQDQVPYKFELGGVSHEACAGLLGLREYLLYLGGGAGGGSAGSSGSGTQPAPRSSGSGTNGRGAYGGLLGYGAGGARADAPPGGPQERAAIETAFSGIQDLEAPLLRSLLSYLRAKPGVRVLGPPANAAAEAALGSRVPTVSFVSDRSRNGEIVAAAARHGVGIRSGHMYAYRLCEALGIDPKGPDGGVVRVSAVHYNTPQDIEKLIHALDTVL